MTWANYLSSADFWVRTLQNWQSELLAIASMAVLAIYLRPRAHGDRLGTMMAVTLMVRFPRGGGFRQIA